MNIQEYKDSKKELYERFAETVKNILGISIAQEKYHLQQIQYRAKNIGSLQEKLKNLSVVDSDKIEEEIKDLAGCRIIFYYNNDVTRFIQSGIIRDNFDVDYKRSKIFYHNKDADSANAQYTANHYLVKLKPEKTFLPEYQDFDGLWCEIQIHTILNHAWSETNHDILYKKPQTEGFGENLLNSMGKKLNDVMGKYLIPAGYEFQKIQLDYQHFLEGKTLLNSNIMQKVKDNVDNNVRYEILERYKEYTLPHFDNYQDELGNIIRH
ncbi:MAG: hypothetical protein A2X78_02815 [Gammaproteobacteria bacterium GWE2_37_16]|nr:MAG: hypothetical protein A2X78_02815 [Gammaproteobacteria bacterium GWE2_37_16]